MTMLQALSSTGHVVTLPGGEWIGQELSSVEASALAPLLSCVSPGCLAPLEFSRERGQFRHDDWRIGCWQSKHENSSYEAHTLTMIERQLIGEQGYWPEKLARARVVKTRGGSQTAVRAVPIQSGHWRMPWRELRDAERSQMTSLWLTDCTLHRGDLYGAWAQKFIQLALSAKSWPVSLGMVDTKKRTITFCGDVTRNETQERHPYVVTSVSTPVAFEDFMWWTRNSGATVPADRASGVRIIEQMTQRAIQLQA